MWLILLEALAALAIPAHRVVDDVLRRKKGERRRDDSG